MDLQIQFNSADLEALSSDECPVLLGIFIIIKQDLNVGNEPWTQVPPSIQKYKEK